VDGGVAQFRRSQSFIDVKYYLMAIQNQRQYSYLEFGTCDESELGLVFSVAG